MKAVASKLRFPCFALFAALFGLLLSPLLALAFKKIAGFLLARGQAPAPSSIKVFDLIPARLSGESNQDSEPFLAIQKDNPQVMVASAFTPNPFSMTGNAPVYVSQDGGVRWVMKAITPVTRLTCEITQAMDQRTTQHSGRLYDGSNGSLI